MAMKVLTLSDFSGGRNTKKASSVLMPNQTPSQLNTWCENGALVKAKGHTAISLTVDGNQAYLIRMCLTNLGPYGANRLVALVKYTTNSFARLVYSDNGTTFYPCETTPTQLSSGNVSYMGMFGGYLYVSDGTNPVVRYDGTNVSSVANFPKYTKCASHKNYMFAAKDSTLYWSEIKDPTTWPINNFQSVNSDDGDVIMALKSWNNGLIIFKRRSMWLLVGETFDPSSADYYIQRIDTPSNFTFISGQTIATHKGVLKFLAADGFYAYTGGTQIYKISDDIQPDIDALSFNDVYLYQYDAEWIERMPKAFVWKNRFYCTIRSGFYDRKVIVQDENDKWWIFYDGSITGNAMDVLSANLGSGEKLYAGSPNITVFLTLDNGDNIGDGSNSMLSYWYSKDFLFPNESKFLYADIEIKKQTSGALTFGVSIDNGSYIDFSIDMTLGNGNVIKKRVPIMRIGRNIKFKVYNLQTSISFEVYRISLFYEPTLANR